MVLVPCFPHDAYFAKSFMLSLQNSEKIVNDLSNLGWAHFVIFHKVNSLLYFVNVFASSKTALLYDIVYVDIDL